MLASVLFKLKTLDYKILSVLAFQIIVNKKRKIYFINNVKFHFDHVENLGTFIEVEAIDVNDEFTTDELKKQCDYYLAFFEIKDDQIIDKSYSDMMLALT